jgi:signal-transduction protein with cAMP-binding, CBS, and nucleotidyltransferase domain
MICPDCKAENIAGADFCESCGHDLHSFALPSADEAFAQHVLSDHLGDLGVEQSLNVAPGDPVALAVHVMQQHGTECVLVQKDGHLKGILTERDILLKAAGGKVDLNAIAVREIMTPDPVVLRALAVALNEMSVGGFRHIPIIKGGRATRVVSVQDVFRHVSAFIQGEPARAP